MNPIIFALRHPIAVMVGIVAIVCGSIVAANRMKIDIFPALNNPVIYVCQPYGGMSPKQMEGLLTNYYEFHFLYVSGIHHVESRNINGMAMMKLFFHPGTDMAQAMGETVASVNRARFMMPPGTVPPFVSRYDTGSAAVGYLVLSSETRSIKEIQDLATLRVRPAFAGIPGISTPPAFGGNQRAIAVNLKSDAIRSLGLTPDDVTNSLMAGNVVSPAGLVRIGDRMVSIPSNAMAGSDVKADIGSIPVLTGDNPRFLEEVASIEDSSDTTTGYVLVDGRRSVYMLVTKRADASTLSVVKELRNNLPKLRELVPEDVKIEFALDQSPIVEDAMWGVGIEGVLGAMLTGLMVLLFLRDWRSVIVVVLNIPLAILAALVGMWLTGQTINLMTLGGLALAVGILVDEATVEVENIHTQMEKTDSIARAVRLGNAETAVPRLLAMLCILGVFVPSVFMEGAARALFMPLSIAVGFSMIASYFLSSTFVPVMSVWLLRPLPHHGTGPTPFQRRYRGLAERLVKARFALVPAYLAATGILIGILFPLSGTEIFPAVDRGQFQFRLRAPTGTRIERTEALTAEAIRYIGEAVGKDKLEISVGYIGMFPSNYPVQAIYQWTSGPGEAYIKIALKKGSGLRIEELKSRLRSTLPDHLRAWLTTQWKSDGLSGEEIGKRASELRCSFEPADIINEVMSFGSPTPIQIDVAGPKIADSLEYAAKLKAELDKIPTLRDLQYVQAQDYPVAEIVIDRRKAALSGMTVEEITRSLVAATASSRYVKPNYWIDQNTGQGYIVQVQVPIAEMDSLRELEMIPIRGTPRARMVMNAGSTGMTSASTGLILLRDVAVVRTSKMPEEIGRYNMRRMVSLVANVEGEDLGRVRRRIDAAIEAAGNPPKATRVDVRGQLEPMAQIIRGLTIGLALAVGTIFLLLTAYFQSIRLTLTSLASVPAALVGVLGMLLVTGSTLNLQSYMGAIMAVGVSVANAILLVTFAEKYRHDNGGNAIEGGLMGGMTRLRPILMTSCAMIVGMLPMALGLSEGGDQTEPLGRAVIGGLLASTFATLFILPAVFAFRTNNRGSVASVSLDPDDPASVHFDGVRT